MRNRHFNLHGAARLVDVVADEDLINAATGIAMPGCDDDVRADQRPGTDARGPLHRDAVGQFLVLREAPAEDAAGVIGEGRLDPFGIVREPGRVRENAQPLRLPFQDDLARPGEGRDDPRVQKRAACPAASTIWVLSSGQLSQFSSGAHSRRCVTESAFVKVTVTG